MNRIECGRGHIYDADENAACPYCNSARQAVNFGGVAVGAASKTAPIGGYGAPGGAAQPPQAYQAPQQAQDYASGRSVLAPNATQPPKAVAQMLEADKQKRVSEMNKTVGPAMAGKDNVPPGQVRIDPVVGWLVCVSGKQKGLCYKLLNRINRIGRSFEMDVCIEGDMTISGENHARVSYSDRDNSFHLLAPEGLNVYYLNGAQVLMPMRLSAYDIIDFGETKLLFLPLCEERFDWNSDIAKDKNDGPS